MKNTILITSHTPLTTKDINTILTPYKLDTPRPSTITVLGPAYFGNLRLKGHNPADLPNTANPVAVLEWAAETRDPAQASKQGVRINPLTRLVEIVKPVQYSLAWDSYAAAPESSEVFNRPAMEYLKESRGAGADFWPSFWIDCEGVLHDVLYAEEPELARAELGHFLECEACSFVTQVSVHS